MKTTPTTIFATLIVAASFSFAAESNMSKEDRQKMAEMHTKMAICLNSDKSVNDCHNEMMGACKEVMGKDGCPMMGMGHMKGMMKGMGHMKGHGSMMDQDEKNNSEKK